MKKFTILFIILALFAICMPVSARTVRKGAQVTLITPAYRLPRPKLVADDSPRKPVYSSRSLSSSGSSGGSYKYGNGISVRRAPKSNPSMFFSKPGQITRSTASYSYSAL